MTDGPVRWVSAFLDAPADLLPASIDYWTAVTGTALGAATGDQDEFLPLEPVSGTGDPCLWMQRLQDGPVALHPDLYVEDVLATTDAAVALGATGRSRSDDLSVLDSPGGLPFCLVRHRGQSVRPEPVHASGGRSIVDQICIDIPPSHFDDEAEFWAALTGWPRTGQDQHSEFNRLTRPARIPYAFLLQRLDDEQPAVSAHLDLAADDRDAETARQQGLGAELVRRTPGWTVMRDPAGMVYCNTTRKPGDV